MKSEAGAAPVLIKHGEHSDENWSLFFSIVTQDGAPSSLAHTRTTWRVIPTDQLPCTRECESRTIQGTFSEFSQWVKGGDLSAGSSFSSIPAFDTGQVAVYADYKYFHELFADDSCAQVVIDRQALWLLPTEDTEEGCFAPSSTSKATEPTLIIDWALHGSSRSKKNIDSNGCGRKDDGGDDNYSDNDLSDDGIDMSIPQELGPEASTFWLGSRGSHTPLHYDSYGYNVVLQIHGTKMWHFWAPTEANLRILRPRRIPYEESSVYCEYDPHRYFQDYNFICEQRNCQRTHSSPHDSGYVPPDLTLLLEAGDVLVVPKHWWHYVHTHSDIALSVNMWVPYHGERGNRRKNSSDNNGACHDRNTQVDGASAIKAENSNDIRCSSSALSDEFDSATEAIGRFVLGALKHSIDGMQWLEREQVPSASLSGDASLLVGQQGGMGGGGSEVSCGRGWVNPPCGCEGCGCCALVGERRTERMSEEEEEEEEEGSAQLDDADANFDLLLLALRRLGHFCDPDSLRDRVTTATVSDGQKRVLLQRLTNALLHPDVLQRCLDSLVAPLSISSPALGDRTSIVER